MSLFGNTNTNQAKPLFGAAPTTTTSSPFTLGGANNNNQQQQQGGASLFGNTANKPATTSLFGTPAASTQPQQQQQTGSSLFGNTANNTNTTNQQTGGGIFGAGATQQSQPQQTTSLFGAQPAAASNTTGSSLFGNTANQNTTQNKPSLSLFGGSTTQPQQAQQQSSSLFGASSATRPGGLTLGQSTTSAPSQTVPGIKIDLSNIRGTTRFNDLHEDLQRHIEQIDNFIQTQIQYKEQCDALMPAHGASLSTVAEDVEFVGNKLETAELGLDNDSRAIDAQKAVVRRDADNARLSFRAVENLKLPQQFHYSGMWQTSSSSDSPANNNTTGTDIGHTDLVSYVSSTADDLARTLASYSQNIAEIEAHLRTLEGSVVQQAQQMMFMRGQNGQGRSREEHIREIGGTLREFEDGIVKVARRVGQAREEVLGVVEEGAGGAGGGDGRGVFGRR